MAERWGLVVEETAGSGDNRLTVATVLEHFTGTREEAMARLEAVARAHAPRHPLSPTRTRLFRTADGFLMVSEGSMRSYGSRFSAVELLHDSDEVKRAQVAAREREKEERAARKAADRAARRAEREARRRR
ncbi:hypothetical protein [Streptomyces avicenniae]|uniref:hypothetical protein n=1 Tax=Streptomyces avicenniae TaxID=500153 RepID=UPI00069C2C88|nr:hypothetical protein [Streptomyces avicenniae]